MSENKAMKRFVKEFIKPLELVKPTFDKPVIESANLASNRSITIIEMGGFHATMLPVKRGEEQLGGAAYVAGAINPISSKRTTILISNGDVFTGQTVSLKNGGEAVVKFMNDKNFNAMTLGIHDFDEGQEVLASRLKNAKFSILAANLIDAKENKHVSCTDHILSMVKPYVVLDSAWKTIAIIGVMKEDTPTFQMSFNLTGLAFKSAKEVITQWLPEIIQELPDIIIVQYNKTSEAESLALQMNEMIKKHLNKLSLKTLPLLVFIGGHSHREPICRLNYLIMEGTDRGYSLGIIDIEQMVNGNKAFPKYTKVSEHYLPDPKIAQLVQEVKRSIEQQDEYLGTTKTVLGRSRFTDSPLGILITEAMKAHAEAEIAFISSGTTKVEIDVGEIHSFHVDQAIPFKDDIILMKLKGSCIKEILEESAKLEADSGGSGGKIVQVAGIRFDYNVKLKKGERVGRIEINKEQLDENRVYTAAVSNYLASGGDGYSQFKEGEIVKNTGDVKAVVKEWIKKLGEVNVQRDMRIVYID